EQPYPIDLIRPEVAAGVCAIVQKMMAKKPDDRYQSAEEIAQALLPFCGAGEATTAVMAATPPTDEAALVTLPPPPQSYPSPFNFGPPAPKVEIAPAAPSKGRSGLVLALCGLAAGFLLAIILVVSLAANVGSKKPASTDSSAPSTQTSSPAR